ncbi:MAG: arginine--tRNA ligase [Omnitrophica bacterium RIFCSPHIGHO2_02_FULL_46_20]|nr:MAG: arginine--tRNA ligase [Omnitrophica bacterium RIFCSPHIGHO2_02_FULL_46_20]
MHHGGIEKELVSFIEKSVKGVLFDLKKPAARSREIIPELEIPKERTHGDISTNIAMKASRLVSMPPMRFAISIWDKMNAALPSSPIKNDIEKIEVKNPGFINFFLSSSHLYKVLLAIQREKHNYGRSSIYRGKTMQIEFVSANPTGPLTIAHGRQAAIGDSLARILSFLSCAVKREYYINDEGTQMNILGNSIRARYRELCGIKEEFPADRYKGAYIIDIAKDFKEKLGKKYVGEKDIKIFREFGLKWILNDIRKDLKDFGVNFDVWYSQKALRKSGKIDKALQIVKDKGYIYEKEGAAWFRSTDFGDDKDRVIIKSDGSYTYLAPDIAYHLDKYRRGFKTIIDIWGPDHHGYIPRIKAAVQALGYEKSSLSVLIAQLVTLYQGGKLVSMSTRAGEFVTLREVIDEVGKDVARFCFLMRRVSSHLEFDLYKVKEQSMENPVYYIQYAHARIWSILEYSKKASLSSGFKSDLLKEKEELDMLRILRQFPLIVVLSANSLEPYTVLQYMEDLARAFHSFYAKHRVVCGEPGLAKARLILVDCVRIVLANGLKLLGVSLPKKM